MEEAIEDLQNYCRSNGGGRGSLLVCYKKKCQEWKRGKIGKSIKKERIR